MAVSKQGADLPAPGGSLGTLGAGLCDPQHGASSLCPYANFGLWGQGTLVTGSSGEGSPGLLRLSRGPGPRGLWLRRHCLRARGLEHRQGPGAIRDQAWELTEALEASQLRAGPRGPGTGAAGREEP